MKVICHSLLFTRSIELCFAHGRSPDLPDFCSLLIHPNNYRNKQWLGFAKANSIKKPELGLQLREQFRIFH